MAEWDSEKRDRQERLDAGRRFAKGKMVAAGDATKLMEAIVRPGDRVCLEGDNQKQADFLAGALAKADKGKVHDLHIVQSGIVLAEHLDLFEKGIATKLDFSYSGPQSQAVARALNGGKVELGAIHTYIELFRPLLHGPHAEGGGDGGATGRPRRQPVHGSQRRGLARRRRGHGLQAGHRRGPGQQGGR